MENRVTLRPLGEGDVETLSLLANNRKIWDNVRDYFPHPYTEDNAREYIRLVSSGELKTIFGIQYDGLLCGCIGLHAQTDVYRLSAELGYWIGEPFWGKGIASAAVGHVTVFGFEQLQLTRIFAGVFSFNSASMKVLEHNGYLLEGISTKAVIKNGQVWDEHRYARTV